MKIRANAVSSLTHTHRNLNQFHRRGLQKNPPLTTRGWRVNVLYNYLIPILSILGLPLDRRSIDIALFRGTCVISANKGNREYGVGWGWLGGSTFRKRDILGEHGPSLRYWYLWAHFAANFFIASFLLGCG